jgi:hypothetical protein
MFKWVVLLIMVGVLAFLGSLIYHETLPQCTTYVPVKRGQSNYGYWNYKIKHDHGWFNCQEG